MPTNVTNTSGTSTTPSTSTRPPVRFATEALTKVWNAGTPIAIGSKGESVKRVQNALNEVGVSVGKADGAFGPKTEAGLKTFQARVKIPQTGKIDAATLRALSNELDRTPVALTNGRFAASAELAQIAAGSKTLAVGSKSEGVKAVQKALDDMGFKVYGGADGAFGNYTARSVKNFQTHAKTMFPDIAVTGKIDAATLKALDVLAPAPGKKGQSTNIPSNMYAGKAVRVVVALKEHRTYLFDANGKVQGIFVNAPGAPGTGTETGLKVVRTKLDQKAAESTGEYLWQNKTVFGTRILDLSWADGSSSGEELHGTNAPQFLGQDASHGCVRHENASIEAMFEALKVGDRVAIVNSINDPKLGPVRR